MFQPKTRRVLVSAALVSALSLLPAQAAAPRSQKPQQTRSERNVAVRLVAVPVWDLLNSLWAKVSVRIDPNGVRLTADDPVVNEPSGQQNRNN